MRYYNGEYPILLWEDHKEILLHRWQDHKMAKPQGTSSMYKVPSTVYFLLTTGNFTSLRGIYLKGTLPILYMH